MNALTRWLGYYSPLFRGRFDFVFAAATPTREVWHQGLGMTGGRFWVRLRGGHDLRRRDASAELECGQNQGMISPTTQLPQPGILVGRADGRATGVTTFPWVSHPPGRSYLYSLSVVGAGGVMDHRDAPTLRLSFDDSGALVEPAPNPVCDVVVESLSGGRFLLRWSYDETDEEAPPVTFEVFNDIAAPGSINQSIVVATVPYRFRQGFFRWTSAGFSHDARLGWAVRAVSAAGAAGAMSTTAMGTAKAAPPPAPVGVRVGGTNQG